MKLAYIAPPFLMLSTLQQMSHADPSSIEKVTNVNFTPISLQANPTVIGEAHYDAETLANTPNSTKNITDFLITHPSVQFNRDWRSAAQQGNLNPSEISINGALPYESKFLLNGLSLNNQINPSSTATTNSHSELMGQSQNVALNTDLICDLTVLDSNISAAYGEFLGGVVQANTCRPQTSIGQIHGQVTYDYTSDHWSKQNFTSNHEEAAFKHSSSDELQPIFTKQGISTALYGNLSETLGINLTASERWSKIPLKSGATQLEDVTQTRESSNLILEGFYTLSPFTDMKVGAYFMESAGQYFQPAVLDSASTHQSKSQALTVQAKHQLPLFSITQNFNIQKNTNQRDSTDHTYSWLSSTSKNWNSPNRLSMEGGFGDIEQAEEKFEYDMKAQFQPWHWAGIHHRVQFGFGYGHYDAFWQRLNDSYWYTLNTNLAGQSCVNQDNIRDTACDEGTTIASKFNGQYSRNRTIYGAGKIDISQNRWHLFLEDTIQYQDRLSLRLGMRGDYDDLTDQYNFAPRTALHYSPFEYVPLQTTLGWNRYYGLNAFHNELQDQKRLLQYTETRTDLHSAWTEVDGSRYGRMSTRSQLETPFSDEWVLGFNAQHDLWEWEFKWVNRHSKKQIRRGADRVVAKPDGSGSFTAYQLDNSGSSKANIYTLSINNSAPILLNNTLHTFDFGADFTQVNRNFSSYDDAFSDPDELILYNGELIRAEDRPASHFNTPWTLRLQWQTEWQNAPLRLHQTFHYRSPSNYYTLEDKLSQLGQPAEYKEYAVKKIPSAFYWDLRATYTTQLSQKLSATWGLTINNVLNKHNRYIDDNGEDRSEIGRQFIADLKLKF